VLVRVCSILWRSGPVEGWFAGSSVSLFGIGCGTIIGFLGLMATH
jgi:hypothetical protein